MIPTPEPCDLLLRGGTVLTLNDRGERFDPGAMAISGGRIRAVGSLEEVTGRFRGEKVLDTTGCVVMPGLVNSHTHAAMTLFRGLADDLPLMAWLQQHIWPAEAKLTADWVAWGTRLACAEMILSGTTSFIDMYLFEDQVAQAAQTAGLRALVGEVLFDFPSPHYGALANGLAFTRDLIAQWRGDPLVRVSVDPHAAYTCAPDLLRTCQALAEAEDVPLHLHLAETLTETRTVRAQHGRRPVRHLEHLGLLSPRLVAAHGVHLTEGEMDLLAQRGVRVAHCPESNMKLGSGIAPVPRLLAKGVPVGLGTDGCASNNDLDLFGEMDTCAKLHKVAALDPTVLPAPQVLAMATRHGASAMGLGHELGQLTPGFLADCIAVDFQAPHLSPTYHPESHLVYAAGGADVRHTIVQGKVLMEDRRLLTLDLEEIRGQVRAFAELVGR